MLRALCCIGLSVIRNINKDDTVFLSEIYCQARLQTFDWIESDQIRIDDFVRDTKGEKIWVAEVDGCVVGFISVCEPENFIHHLYVSPDFSGLNIGTQLLRTCLSNIGRPVTLKCVSANVDALRFYESRGWRTISVGVGEEGEYHLMQANET